MKQEWLPSVKVEAGGGICKVLCTVLGFFCFVFLFSVFVCLKISTIECCCCSQGGRKEDLDISTKETSSL